MQYGTIVFAFAIIFSLSGCTKKPDPQKRHVGGAHLLSLEVPQKVVVDTKVTAVASWQGGAPPFTIVWNYPRTLGLQPARPAISPDTEEFFIPRGLAEIGQKYYVMATVTDSAGVDSVLRKQFFLADELIKFKPDLFGVKP